MFAQVSQGKQMSTELSSAGFGGDLAHVHGNIASVCVCVCYLSQRGVL